MARKNLGVKTYIYPQPVMVIGTYDKEGKANAMCAAWGGISGEKEVTLCIDSGHLTAENLQTSGAFTISIGTSVEAIGCDYVGLVSGRKDPGKLDKTGWTILKSEFVNAPLFKELPLTLECRVISYDPGNDLLRGEIVNVSIDEKILDRNGNIDPILLSPIAFDPANHRYLVFDTDAGPAFKIGNILTK